MDKNLSICFSTVLGNLSTEYESKANISSYTDFFSKLYQSNFPVSLHLTGSFLQIMQSKDQAFDNIIKTHLEKKQIELIGGAYFSPLFPIINSADLVGQIDMYVTALRRIFPLRTRSVYVPFSAWNPSLVSPLKKSGTVEYCLLDKRLFLRQELSPFSPVCLEDAGKVITAVPYIQKQTMSESPEAFYQSIADKKNLNDGFNIAVVFIPHTVFAQLLTKDETGESWIDRFSRIVAADKNANISTIYKSIKEQKFFPSGFIEANIILNDKIENVSVKKIICQNACAFEMYKKLMYVSVLTNQIRGDKQRKISATQQMWKSQNAFFFLQAAFYPLENRNLLFNFYKNLLLAEKTARNQNFADSLVPFDFNLDGVDEYISQTKNINAYVNLCGGKIFEYDFLPSNKNFCTLMLHDSTLFADAIFDPSERKNIHERGIAQSLKNERYQLVKYSAPKKTLSLKLPCIYRGSNITVKKNYSFNGDFITVQYIIKNESEKKLSALFASSLDIAVGKLGNTIPSMTVYARGEKIESGIESADYTELAWLQLNDAESKTRLSFTPNEKLNLIVVPIKQRENDIGVKLYFYWELALESGNEAEKLITMQAEKIRVRKTK